MSYLKDREIWLSNVPTGNPPAGYFWKFIQNGKVVVRDSSGNNQIMVATSGSQAITGSLIVTEGITGTVSSASYVEYSNVANKPALVSGSEQITYSGLTGIPSGIVSGSAQIASFGIFATTGSNGFNGSQSITGSLTVTGQVVAQTLNVQQVTSSIVYSSGSNIFGNSVSNTQQFTGSLQVSGSSHYLLGNVGVGITPNAGVKLDVGFTSDNRSIARLSSNAANRMVGVTFYGNSAESATIGYEGGSEILSGGQQGDFIIRNVLANKNIILATNNSGNIGINTTSPNPGGSVSGTTVLTISPQIGVSERWGILELAGNRTSGGNQVGEIKFTNINTTNTVVASITALNTATAVTGGSLSFSTKTDAGALTERLNIASTGAATFSSSVTANGNSNTFGNASLSGRAVIIQAGSTNQAIMFKNSAGGDGTLFINGTSTTMDYNFNTYSVADALVIKNNGNVGIGTASPLGKLDVYRAAGGSGTAAIVISNGEGGGGRNWGLSTEVVTAGDFAILQSTTNGGTPSPTSTNVKFYINPSGNVGIGTASPSTNLHVEGPTISYGQVRILSTSNSGGEASIHFGRTDQTLEQRWTVGQGVASIGNSFGFYTGGSPRMVLTTGGTLLLGTTSGTGIATGSSVNQGVDISGGVISIQTNNNSNNYWSKATGYTSPDFTAHFVNGNYVGGISTNGSSTNYATASDYRLKQDLKDFDGITLINKIKTYDYEWKVDNTRMFGVIAHELQEVLPYAVTGEKDAERMQGVDYSKLIPVLVKAIQEQQTLIESLKSRIEILEQ